MPSSPDESFMTGLASRHLGLIRLISLCLVVSGAIAAYLLAHQSQLQRIETEALSSAQSRAQSLESILSQQRAVAAILSDDDLVRDALRGLSFSEHEAVSIKLDRMRADTQSSVIYVLDRDGDAIAASNWDEPDSFVGVNYSFRDYFTKALRDGTAMQFALGTVSHRPGLYLSHDVAGPEGVLGVVVVKTEFDKLESAWAISADQTFVTGAEGDVILSSRPETRFRPAQPLASNELAVARPIALTPWTLHVVTSTASARQSDLIAALGAGSLMFLAAFGLDRTLLGRRRALARVRAEANRRLELEAAVRERTKDLQDEMAERRRAEQRLAGMQADLVQANKLATLGQVTAGLAHEINQPLATIRLLAENAQAMLPKRVAPDVVENLGSIVRMSDRISQITTELRGFSRKATGEIRPVKLRDAIEASVLLTASRRRVEGAQIVLPDIPPDLTVMVEAVRLEQVLVNLIQNSQEAMAGQADPRITLGFTNFGERVELSITDNGPGLSPEIVSQLFMPFATSKPDGLGLGLVIAQGIMRDFGGDLRADPFTPGQGATFRIDLPRGPK